MTEPADQAPPPPATLADVFEMLTELANVQPMGRASRQLLFRLHDAATELNTMTGLVLAGDVHRITKMIDYAPCGCRDGRHAFTRDGSAWFGRGHWTTHSDAEKRAAKNQTHIVRRTVAYTDMEVTQ